MSHSGSDCNTLRNQAESWHAESLSGNLGYVSEVDAAEADISSIAAAAVGAGSGSGRVTSKHRKAVVCPCPHWKRAMDIVGAIAVLIILSPLLLAVAVLIKSVSRGPVFFRQRRFGAAGRSFILWKFRTIEINDASAPHHSHVSDLMARDQPLKKRDYELAIIPGGRFLRKLGLDELPQLFNVLKGEMSLVGPRPDVVPPRNYQSWQRRRFDVVPGMTGLWQVCGKNETTFSTMMRLDILYIRRRSIWLDMIILLRTIPAVARN